jgi:putative transposase
MSQHLPVLLTSEERQQLHGYTRRGVHHSRVIARAQMLLMADKNQPSPKTRAEIAQILDCSIDRVIRTCRAFTLHGMHDALHDRPRCGAPPKITGDIEAKMVTLACSQPPLGRKRWTLRLIAEHMVSLGYVDSISNVAVYKRLKKMKSSRGR